MDATLPTSLLGKRLRMGVEVLTYIHHRVEVANLSVSSYHYGEVPNKFASTHRQIVVGFFPYHLASKLLLVYFIGEDFWQGRI